MDKVSIITVCKNSEGTISDTINSVLNQTYGNIEYIIIDGMSNDRTMEIINSYKGKIDKIISEKDNGIYHAMNKGIGLATGKVVGILNSDDFFVDPNIIRKIIEIFLNNAVDSVFADLVYVNPRNLNKVIRRYNSGKFKPHKVGYGIVPAHPAFFVKRNIYNKFGVYRTDLKIASDFEFFARIYCTHSISYYYYNRAIVKMRTGGKSTSFSNILKNNIEILKACEINGIKTNFLKILYRYYNKSLEILEEKKINELP